MADEGVKIQVTKDNTDEIISSLSVAVKRTLKIIGENAEKYAKALCPVGTSKSTGKKGYRGGTLRRSITHKVEKIDGVDAVQIGSNVEYAPYVELGTGPNFTLPPEWEQFQSKKGSGMAGVGYVKARPYLAPAIKDHLDEYRNIIKQELQ